jgi:hypothetical protein
MAERTPTNTRISPNTDGKLTRNVDWFMNWRNVPGYAWLLSEWIADVIEPR